jgi:hypothetical protein
MEKMKKIISILSIMLMITSSIVIVSQNNSSVKATGDQAQQGQGNSIGLDLNYMWDNTVNISNAVHYAYLGKELRKGRLFGSKGAEVYARGIIYKEMKKLNLDGVQNITLGPIKNTTYAGRYYTNFVNVTNFNIHINTPEYYLTNRPRDVPKNESFATPSTKRELGYYSEKLNHNFSGTNVYIDIQCNQCWAFGHQNIYVPCQPLSSCDIIIGNVTYVNVTSSMPTDQEDKVILLNETNGSINKLNNVTDADGIVLIHNTSDGYYVPASVIENYSFPIVRVNSSREIYNVTYLLRSGELMLVHNFLDRNKLRFTYEFNTGDTYWPNYPFYELYQYSNSQIPPLQLWRMKYATFILRWLSIFHPNRPCKGLIIYSEKEDQTHYSLIHSLDWFRFDKTSGISFPQLPVFTVNKTVGEFLKQYANDPDNNVTAWEQQQYLEENHSSSNPSDWTAGVKAYDVVGHLNITKSPGDKIVVISNRHDSMVGEMPGDSGAGGGIVLGIAKFFHDHNIKPKYNLTFLQTTGEEFGMRGAQYYSDVHKNDNISYFIGFDQLGMNETGVKLELDTSSSLMKKIVSAIASQTNYRARTNNRYDIMINDPWNYHFKLFTIKHPLPYLGHEAEDVVWMQRDIAIIPPASTKSKTRCETVSFGGASGWTHHHQTGLNFSEADSLKNTDRNALNVIFEIAWNITKYFTVNPDCKFNGTIGYTSTDSPYDPDTLNDTIKATIPMKSTLPQDIVRVKAYLTKENHSVPSALIIQDFIITNSTKSYVMNITLPPYCSPGKYSATLYLYNSTGRINDIINIPAQANDSSQSGYFDLYPRGNEPPVKPNKPCGNTSLRRFEIGTWNSTTSDPNHDLVGEQWYERKQAIIPRPYIQFDDTGLYDPESTTPTVSHRFLTVGTHQIKVKAYDQYSSFLHRYESPFSQVLNVSVVPWVNILNPQQQLHQNQGNVLHLVQQDAPLVYSSQSGASSPTFDWDFHDSTSRHASGQNASHPYSSLGMHYITLNVTDSQTQLTGSITIPVRVSIIDSNFNMSYFHGAAPYTAISFRNVSKAKAGNHITNCTWDFGDGTVSYQSNVNHIFTMEGDYNVTLTVKDNQSNIDTDYCLVHITMEPRLPEISEVQSPGLITNASDATILAVVDPTDRNLSSVKVQITTPNNTTGNYTMTNLCDDVYMFTLNNSSQVGQYNFTVWATDIENNTNSSSGSYYLMLPVLTYMPPTPDDGAYVNHSWVKVNVSVNDTCNTSAFIDWNRTLHGYWSMDIYNSTCIFDNSSYMNHGRFYNGMNASSIVSGKFGKGLQFDGADDYVDLGNDTSLNLGTGDFTFMVWEKSHASSYANTTVLLSNQPENANWNGYVCGVKNTAFFYTVQNGQTTSINGIHDVTDNTWHHLAFVRKAGNLSLYVDRAFDTGRTGTVRNITNSKDTCFSYENRTDWYHFDGVLDEAQLYTRALGRDEINASYNNGLYRLCHNFTGLADGTYEYYAHAIDVNGSQGAAEIRQVTVDTVAPTISTVSASPSPVGLGFNVTINTNVTDTGSGVKNVSAAIAYPLGVGSNPVTVPMSHISGTMYRYVFSGTWHTGRYNYTIIAYDNASNPKTSAGHSFNVSASATMSISTLKDAYGANQYINITDPPNPPENLTVVGRGLTWDTYYNTSSGCNILESYQGPVNYQVDNGSWTPINNTLRPLTTTDPAYSYGYRIGNVRGLFGVYLKPDVSSDWPVAFTYNQSNNPTTFVVRNKLVGVGYVDPQSNWAYHYLQSVQSSQGQTNGNMVTYPGAFTGTNITWSYSNTELKEAITMSNATKTVLQNHPPSQYGLHDASSYLVFITKLEYQNLSFYNDSGMLTGNVTITDKGVDFRNALGQFKCALPLGEAYELYNESARQTLTYRIVHLNGDTYLLSGLKISDLNSMVFPVVIDPTLSVNSLSNDGYIWKSDKTYNTAWSAPSGTVDSSSTYLSIGQTLSSSVYYLYRGFVLFDTSSLPSNAYLDSAVLSLYKKDDFSTTDFLLTIQNGQPTYPHNPLQATDYGKSLYSGNGGSLNTANFVNGRNNITLTNLSWVNKIGTTKLCLRSSRDISGTTPTGNEYVNVYSANAPLQGEVPKLIITYRNQSKIKNTGSTNIKGYLLIQIQYYNSTQGKWLVEKDTINETSARTINTGQQLALDRIFNGHVRTNDLSHNMSNYRVYAAFRDPYQNILKTNDGKQLVAWWQFTGPKIL